MSLNNADHPGLSLISIQLDGPNYDDRNAVKCIALNAKNKIGFIDGTIIRPPDLDHTFRLWSRCNSMVKSWLLNSISPQIYRSILRLNDASDIWRDLHGRFHLTNLSRTFNLTQEIQDLRQGTMSLSEYYTTLKTLWDNLEGAYEPDKPFVCGNAASIQLKADRAKIVKFLAGLNESYNIIRRQIIMKKVLPSLDEIYNILDQDDSQKGFSTTVPSPTAFQVSKTNLTEQSISYVQNGPNKGHPICSFSKRVGHIAERCYKKHGFALGFVSKYKGNERPSSTPKVAAQVALSPLVNAESKNLTVENMIGNLSKDQIQQFIALFSSQLQSNSTYAPNEPSTSGINFSLSTQFFVGILMVSQNTMSSQTWVESFVNLPTGITIKISGVGKIQLKKHICLNNVLFIPEFRLNLLSISSLTSDIRSRVIFDPSSYTFQDPTRVLTIGQGRRIGNLYVLDTTAPHVSVNAVVDHGVWHMRLGHPSYHRLDVISEALVLRE